MLQAALKNFFSKDEQAKIVRAIQEAEKNTSGEVRVHLVKQLKGDGLQEGKKIFEKIGMTRTKQRNGILFLLGLQDHRFVLLGDQGIHEKVSEDFWERVRDVVLVHFQTSRFTEGLVDGIRSCGEQLKKYFPYQKSDQNELSDEIST